MRLATWNIGGGFISAEQNLEFNTESIGYFIDELKKIRPDIVCLQEIHVSENNDQPRMIAQALGFDYYRVESFADSHLKSGEKLSFAIISRYPIQSVKFIKLPYPNLYFIKNGKKEYCHQKGFLAATIQYEGNYIQVLSGHIFPFRKFGKDFLADEYKNIRDEIERIMCDGNLPTVIGADMNYEDIDRLIPRVFQRGFRSVLPNKATTPKGRRYDRIIVSGGWTFANPTIIQGQADHYLCFADIDLEKE